MAKKAKKTSSPKADRKHISKSKTKRTRQGASNNTKTGTKKGQIKKYKGQGGKKVRKH